MQVGVGAVLEPSRRPSRTARRLREVARKFRLLQRKKLRYGGWR